MSLTNLMGLARIKSILTGIGKLSDTNFYKRRMMLVWTQVMKQRGFHKNFFVFINAKVIRPSNSP